MTYVVKPLSCEPSRTRGLSERMIISRHENNDAGAVKRLNVIDELNSANGPVFLTTPGPRHLIGSIALAAAVMAACQGRAGDQFKQLDGSEINRRVVGQDITDGSHWSMYVRRDGVLIGAESGSSWSGSWKIKNDRLCLAVPNSTSAECNEVWMSGTLVRMRAGRDEEFDAMVAPHRRK